MLKQRTITAVALLPLALWLVLVARVEIFALALALVYCVMADEFFLLSPDPKPWIRRVMHICFPLVLVIIAYLQLSLTLWLAMAFDISIGYFICIFPRGTRCWYHRPVVLLMLFLSLCASFQALIQLKISANGRAELLCLLLLIWAADTGAYFFGKTLGCVRLIPAVSPGKSVEGLFGGFAVTLVVAALFVVYSAQQQRWWQWSLLATVTFLASVLGDLMISMLKRQAGVKDTGQLLPGHGGVLDRLDSLVCASPVFVIVNQCLGIGA